jgi:hypothetical protein
VDITGNPLIILAADVATVAVIVWTGDIHIWEISFGGYTAQASSCLIENLNGKQIWYTSGEADIATIRSGHVGTVNGGIKIPAVGITSGTVRIFFK